MKNEEAYFKRNILGEWLDIRGVEIKPGDHILHASHNSRYTYIYSYIVMARGDNYLRCLLVADNTVKLTTIMNYHRAINLGPAIKSDWPEIRRAEKRRILGVRNI